jgi:transformation/transcription domain-associated protein
MDKIFEPKEPIKVKDLSELNIEALLSITYTATPIQVDKKMADGRPTTEKVRDND